MSDIFDGLGKGGKGKPDSRLSSTGKTESKADIEAYEKALKSGLGKKTAAAEAFDGKKGPRVDLPQTDGGPSSVKVPDVDKDH